MHKDLFEVSDGKVSLNRNPELTELEAVKAALMQQVKDNESGALLDMTAMDSISSTTIGMAVAVHLRAAEAGRTLTIRILDNQKRLFELTMLTSTLSLEIVGANDR